MKQSLHIVALLIALATLGTWLATGAHRGWTKTHVTVIEIDPVTGIENPVPKDKFVMGVELLGTGLAVAAALTAASFFFKAKLNKQLGRPSDSP